METGLAQVRPMKKFSHETGGAVKLTEVGAGRTLVEQEQVRFEDLVDYLTGKIRSEETLIRVHPDKDWQRFSSPPLKRGI